MTYARRQRRDGAALPGQQSDSAPAPLVGNSYSHFRVNPDMPKIDLLPGVSSDRCLPAAVCDTRREVRNARRRAFWRDAIQVTLLLAVNYLFVHYPSTRLPFLERNESELLLAAVSAVVLTSFWLTRMLPRWSARRTAETWSRREQEQFRRSATLVGARRTSAESRPR